MTVNRIDPHDFLAFVHEIDLSCVPPDPALAAAMTELRGHKIIHTNGSVRHAERLLDHLGLDRIVQRHHRYRGGRVRSETVARRL